MSSKSKASNRSACISTVATFTFGSANLGALGFFVGTLHGKRITLGLGTALDVTLAKARERAAEARLLIIDYAPGGLSLSNLEGRKARSEKVQIALRKVASNPANAILKIRLISDLKAPFPRRER